MFRLKNEQLHAMEVATQEPFKEVLLAILLELRPEAKDWKILDLRKLISDSVQVANQFGFRTKRELTLFAVLAFDFGPMFPFEHRFSQASNILGDARLDPLVRLDQAAIYMASACEP